jgi:hypothetical protein
MHGQYRRVHKDLSEDTINVIFFIYFQLQLEQSIFNCVAVTNKFVHRACCSGRICNIGGEEGGEGEFYLLLMDFFYLLQKT